MSVGFFVAVFAMFAVAGAFVLPALWRGSRSVAIAVAAFLPLAAVPMYMLLGTPAALQDVGRADKPSVEREIDALAKRMQADPNNLDGWVLLARARKAQGRFADAQQAFARALKLAPKEPGLLVELAETMAQANPQHQFDDDALKLLQSAQDIDPHNQRALWFLGIAKYQRKDFAGAASTWQPLLALAPANTRAPLLQQIDAARAKAGLPPLPADAVPAPAPPLLHLRVDISPALRARLKPDDVLYVFARAVDGPPMPLAVKRIPAKEFPLNLVLSDDDGPMPTVRLSQQKTVALEARVSHSGDAIAQPGDLETVPVSATVGGKDAIALTIDSVHP